MQGASVLRSRLNEEVIAYCSSCQNKIRNFCWKFEGLSDNFFNGSKNYPIVKWKGVCVIELNCHGL